MGRSLWGKLARHEGALVAQRAGIGHPLRPACGLREVVHMHKLRRRRPDGLCVAAALAGLPQLPQPEHRLSLLSGPFIAGKTGGVGSSGK